MKFFNNNTVITLFVITTTLLISACDQKTSGVEINSNQGSKLSLIVYKRPNCNCCKKWISHMSDAGFDIKVKNQNNLKSIKQQFNIQAEEQSCHTAVSKDNQYVFEGHIPANIVQRFIEEKPPEAIGLTVPGMPIGSPGMEHGDLHTPYDVFMLMNDGSTKVYEHVE